MKSIRVVAAIILRDNKVFTAARGYGEYKGQWEFPGGKIEQGETSQQTLIREIREELDVDIEVGNLIETIEYDYPSFHLCMDCFAAKIIAGNIALKEALDFRWLDKSELYNVQWLPADRLIIEKVKALLE